MENYTEQMYKSQNLVPIKESYTTDEVMTLLRDLSTECLCEDGEVKGPAAAYTWIRKKLMKNQ